MNCQDARDLLDDRPRIGPNAVQLERLDEHLRVCEACRSAWHAYRTLRSLQATLAPEPRLGFFEETLRLVAPTPRGARQRAPFWLGGALGAALAASIAVVAIVGIRAPASFERSDAVPGLTIALDKTQDITIAITSAEALAGAQIRVALSGGIAMQGAGGRRDIRWTADINAGVNRLTLPVRAISTEDAQLLVEVLHDSKSRTYLVPVEIVASRQREGSAVG